MSEKNFSSIKNFSVPKSWIDNALSVPATGKKKPVLFLNLTRTIATAATIILVCTISVMVFMLSDDNAKLQTATKPPTTSSDGVDDHNDPTYSTDSTDDKVDETKNNNSHKHWFDNIIKPDGNGSILDDILPTRPRPTRPSATTPTQGVEPTSPLPPDDNRPSVPQPTIEPPEDPSEAPSVEPSQPPAPTEPTPWEPICPTEPTEPKPWEPLPTEPLEPDPSDPPYEDPTEPPPVEHPTISPYYDTYIEVLVDSKKVPLTNTNVYCKFVDSNGNEIRPENQYGNYRKARMVRWTSTKITYRYYPYQKKIIKHAGNYTYYFYNASGEILASGSGYFPV